MHIRLADCYEKRTKVIARESPVYFHFYTLILPWEAGTGDVANSREPFLTYLGTALQTLSHTPKRASDLARGDEKPER